MNQELRKVQQILKKIFFVLFLIALPAYSQTSASISESGIGVLKYKNVQVNLTEGGVAAIRCQDQEVCGPIEYQMIDSNYKYLLASPVDIESKRPLNLVKSVITSEQVLKKGDVIIRCKQQTGISKDGMLTINYTVFPEQLASDFKFKAHRVALEVKDKELANSIEVVAGDGQKSILEKFAGSLMNPSGYTFSRNNGGSWDLSVKPTRGTSKVSVQLYSSYSKFVKMSVASRNIFTLQIKIDLTGMEDKSLKKKLNKAADPVLTGKELENIQSGGENLLKNGSFEFDFNDWKPEWSGVCKSSTWQVTDNKVSQNYVEYTGKDLRKVKLISFPKARNGQDVFTLSADLKSSQAEQVVKLGVAAAPVHAQKRSQFMLWKSFRITDDWQNYSVTFKLPENWLAENICFMVGPAVPGTPFAVDNAIMFAGKPPYKESVNDKYGIRFVTGKTGNIFVKNEKAKVQFELVNNSPETENFKVEITGTDIFANQTILKTADYKVKKYGLKKIKLRLNTRDRGYFKVVCKMTDSSGNVKTSEFNYSIITDNSSLDRLKFGVNFHMERPHEDQLDTALDILGQMGFGTIRAWWDWSDVEGIKGSYNWSKLDYQVELCRKHNLEIVPVILRMYGPKWTVPDRFQNPPDDLTLWDNYVHRTSQRYKGKIKYYEIWNEPDVTAGLKYKPELYLDILKRSAKIIKENDPAAKIIGICGSHMWFFESIFKTGGLDHLDVISYHSYYYKYNPEIALLDWNRKFRKNLEPYKKDKPVWNTEVGVIDGRGGHIESEENRNLSCGLLVRNFVSSFATGTDRVYWFTASMISLYGHSIFDYQYAPTPAAVAFNAMSEKLSGLEFSKSLDSHLDKQTFCFNFKDAKGGSTAVMWFKGFPAERTVNFNSDKLAVYDVMGNILKPDNGDYNLISGYPLYLVADSSTDLEKIYKKAVITEKMSEGFVFEDGGMIKASPTVGPLKTTNDGMIIDWNIFGPYPNPGGRGFDRGLDIDFLREIGGETGANLNLDTTVKYTWPKDMKHYSKDAPTGDLVKSKEYHGASVADYYGDKTYVDLLKLLKPEKYVIGYAFCYIEAKQDMKAKIKMGSDDGCKLFLNHKQVWVNNTYRKAELDNDVIEVELKKGLNPLLLKISQDSGGWGFYVRLTDMNDKPLSNIAIWL